MQNIRLGFLSIIRTTFDVPLAEQMTQTAYTALSQAGYSLLGSAKAVTTLDEAQAAADSLAEQAPDLLLIFQATFADSTMVMALAQRVDAPLLLWAVPEEHTGGRLRLNSLCGINLAAHALTRSGYRYFHLYAAPDHPQALETVQTLARAAAVRRQLKGARIGRVGENPAGFETCLVDAPALKEQFGLEIVPVDLREQVFAGARAADSSAVQAVEASLAQRVQGLDTVDGETTRRTLGVYVTLKQIAAEQRLNGMAVRCWPEFFTELGCAACGAMSLMSDGLTPCSCEADVNGTITQYILQSLSGAPAFGTDIVSLDAAADALVIWHCGLAPLSMADDAAAPGVTIHSNRKMPLLLEFTLKPGVVTVARLSEASGEYRLVISRGEIVRAPKHFSGTSGLVRFSRPANTVLNDLLAHGLEHHVSITYGDFTSELRALASMLAIPVLEL